MYIIITDNKKMVEEAKEKGYRVIDVLEKEESIVPQPQEAISLQSTVTDLLLSLGMKTQLKGFQYLKFLIQYCIQHPYFENEPITRTIYPLVGVKFHTTASRVERAIRHAIESSYTPSHPVYQKILGVTEAKPTNDQFLTAIVLYITEKILKH